MTDLRNAVEDRPTSYNTNAYGAGEPSFGTRNAGYGSTPSAAPMPATDYYQSRWEQLKEQSWFPMAVVGCAVVLFALFVGYAYNQGASQGTAAGTAPVIAASEEPFKVAPADAGGMVVPNQDTLVFDQIAKPADGTTPAATTENLIPPPEAPLVSAADAATTTAATPAATTEATAATVTAPQPAPATTVAAMTAGETPPPAPATTATTTPAPAAQPTAVAAPVAAAPVAKPAEATPKAAPVVKAETPKPTPVPAAAPAPKVVTAKAAPPAPTMPVAQPAAQAKPAVLPPVAPVPTAVAAAPTATTAVSSGAAKVQLGSFGSETAAKAAWATFQRKYGPQLGSVTPNFVRADLGAKGVFYRVQGVGLSAASATSICQAINAQQAGGCIVAK